MKKKILVIGSLNRDMVVEVENFPRIGETIIGKNVHYTNGGKGANQAVACSRLGGEVTMLGCVGNDMNGEYLLSALHSYGVDISNVYVTDQTVTGLAVINVSSSGDNSIIVVQGANQYCDVTYLKEHDVLFKRTDCILLQMEIPLDSIEYCIQRANQLHKLVILNPAPMIKKLDTALLSKVDYIIPNETEYEALELSDSFITNNENVKPIVTLGNKGASYFERKERRWVRIPPYSVEAIDTVAAGDSFIGAIVTCILEGIELDKAIQYANATAAITVTRKGAQEAIPKRAEVIEFMKEKEESRNDYKINK